MTDGASDLASSDAADLLPEKLQPDEAEADSYSDSSEPDAREFGMYQQLPIPEGDPDFDSGEPDDAAEYLRRVRYEAAQLPRVVTASIDPRQFDAQRTQYVPADALPETADWAMPDECWLQRVLTDFGSLRLHVQQAAELEEESASPGPSGRDSLAWRRYCFGGSGASGAQAPSPKLGGVSDGAHLPTMALLASIDKIQADVLFQRHVDWLVYATMPAGEHHLLWLYALMARLEKPLAARSAAQLRALLRHCSKLRARVKEATDPVLPHLNVLIALAGLYFGQDEAVASQGMDELP